MDSCAVSVALEAHIHVLLSNTVQAESGFRSRTITQRRVWMWCVYCLIRLYSDRLLSWDGAGDCEFEWDCGSRYSIRTVEVSE